MKESKLKVIFNGIVAIVSAFKCHCKSGGCESDCNDNDLQTMKTLHKEEIKEYKRNKSVKVVV